MLRPQRNPGSRVWTFRHPAALSPARPPRRDIEFVRRLSVASSTRTPSASVISTYRELASSLVQPNRTESSQNDSISYSPSGTATRNALDNTAEYRFSKSSWTQALSTLKTWGDEEDPEDTLSVLMDLGKVSLKDALRLSNIDDMGDGFIKTNEKDGGKVTWLMKAGLQEDGAVRYIIDRKNETSSRSRREIVDWLDLVAAQTKDLIVKEGAWFARVLWTSQEVVLCKKCWNKKHLGEEDEAAA